MIQRIDYIDRMKGLAIFLVVLGHVYYYAFERSNSILSAFVGSFHMPLFMFLSGLVACSGVIPPYWSLSKIIRKTRALLLPMLVFGLLFSNVFSSDFFQRIIGFLESPSKYGYWYLMTLTIFYLSLSLYRFNVKQKWYFDVVLAMFVWGGMFLLWKYTAQNADYFCLLNCGNFYPFFMLGVFTTKYKLLDKVKRSNWLFSVCLFSYIVLFNIEIPFHAFLSLNRHIILPFCMLYVIVTLFLARNGKNSPLEKILEYVGKRTLDIYVIHYFIICHLHLGFLDKWMETTDNILLSLFLSIFIAVIVLCLSMFVGSVLHKGVLIEKIAFGK